MALVWVDDATAQNRADGDTVGITVTHGFTLSDGDVLYATISRSDDIGTGWVDSLGTWTPLITLSTAAGNDMLSTVLRKVITNAAGEPATYTFLTSGVSGTNQQTAVMVQLSGADTTTPEDVAAGSNSGINDFTPDSAPSVAIPTAGDLFLVSHCASMDDGVSGKTGGPPSTFTESGYIERIFAGQLGSFTEMAYLENASGTIDPGVWTGTPDDSTSEFHVFYLVVKVQVAASTENPYPYVVGGYFPTEG